MDLCSNVEHKGQLKTKTFLMIDLLSVKEFQTILKLFSF